MKQLLSTALLGLACTAVFAQPRIAVTDLAYTQAVAEYFEAANIKEQATLNANHNSVATTYQGSGTYVAGTCSYVEQRELGSFANDIKGALLKGSNFRLVQGQVVRHRRAAARQGRAGAQPDAGRQDGQGVWAVVT